MKSYSETVNERAQSQRTIMNQGKTMDFADALRAIKAGSRLCRVGWNGRGMFVFLVNGSHIIVNREPLMSALGEGAHVDYHGHIDMKTAQGYVVPWLPSQVDILADDWMIAE